MGKPLSRKFKVVSWNPACDTLEKPEDFCGHRELRARDSQGNDVYECLGHDLAAVAASRMPGTFKSSGYLGVEILPDAVDGDEQVVADWWDYFPSEKRFVRVHEVPRFGLLSLDERRHEG